MNGQDNYSYEEVLELTKQGIEIWRRVVVDDIVFDYEVSNLGRIKSLRWHSKKEEIGYGSLNKTTGYMRKDLRYTDENGDKKYKKYYIHRLVATMFIPNPFDKLQVDHGDTNKTNNRVDNLNWVTHEENMNNDTTKKNMSKMHRGKTQRKLTDEEKYPYVTEDDILIEEWRGVIGYEGIYEISNMGRVRGLGFHKSGRSREGLLQPYINKYGYQTIGLTDRNGKLKIHHVHRLVAIHFISNQENKTFVDHINTNKIDNRYFNLRWVSQKENINNDKTKEKFTRPIIVLDKNGNVISSGLGLRETAQNIGVGENILICLLKSHKPYRASVHNGRNDTTLLRSFNGIRVFYLDKYNEEEVIKEIKEDETDYSYCMGDLVCIYPDGRISKPMSGKNLAKKLGISDVTVKRIKDSKKPYKASINGLSKLDDIRIIYYEDYLKEQNR